MASHQVCGWVTVPIEWPRHIKQSRLAQECHSSVLRWEHPARLRFSCCQTCCAQSYLKSADLVSEAQLKRRSPARVLCWRYSRGLCEANSLLVPSFEGDLAQVLCILQLRTDCEPFKAQAEAAKWVRNRRKCCQVVALPQTAVDVFTKLTPT